MATKVPNKISEYTFASTVGEFNGPRILAEAYAAGVELVGVTRHGRRLWYMVHSIWTAGRSVGVVVYAADMGRPLGRPMMDRGQLYNERNPSSDKPSDEWQYVYIGGGTADVNVSDSVGIQIRESGSIRHVHPVVALSMVHREIRARSNTDVIGFGGPMAEAHPDEAQAAQDGYEFCVQVADLTPAERSAHIRPGQWTWKEPIGLRTTRFSTWSDAAHAAQANWPGQATRVVKVPRTKSVSIGIITGTEPPPEAEAPDNWMRGMVFGRSGVGYVQGEPTTFDPSKVTP